MHISAVEKKRNVVLIILLPVTTCLLALMGMFFVWVWCRRKLRGRSCRTHSLHYSEVNGDSY